MPILTLQPDETTGKDTYTYVGDPSNHEAASSIFVGYDEFAQPLYGWIQFDLSALPAGATITSALLTLTVQAVFTVGSVVAQVRRVTASWLESMTAAGSFDATVQDSETITGAGVYTFDITTLVQQWYAGTYPNYGVALVSTATGNYAYINSSSHATAADRPKLTIAYAEAGSNQMIL